jgi:hypothetical protein
MKKLLVLIALFISGNFLYAQDYLDMFKASYSRATLGNIDNEEETEVGNMLIEAYFPMPLTDKIVAITAFTYENTRLGLSNNAFGVTAIDDRTNLVMTRLNLGVKVKHGNKWTGTYIALPKLASDFNELGADDFQIGGIALFEKKYSSRKGLKFGAYASTENFGTTITPLVGVWYKSRNRKFYINATLPIRADINYTVAKHFSLGANLLTSIKSYNMSQFDTGVYVQEESIRFSTFVAYGFLEDTLILRGRVGLDTTDYGVYNQGDTIGVQVLTFQVSGDDRNRLNSEFASAPFVGLDLIFRAGL